MKLINKIQRIFTLLLLGYVAFGTVSCDDDNFNTLDDLVVSLSDQIADTAYFGTKFKVDLIANKANSITISLSPEANQSEKAFDTTIVNTNNRYLFSKNILIPADGTWSGDYILKVTSGSVEKTKKVHFTEPVGFPAIYVPGAHQGWDPATAPSLVSVNKDDIYEGYVNFPNPGTEFKITSHPNWDNTNYGTSGSGSLSTEGGNLTLAEAGYYLLKVNLNDNTWTATKTNWGAIGNATAGGWDADQDLTYNAAEKVWKATLPLTAGEMKFRANDAWTINLGPSGAGNALKQDGDNIQVTTAGTYEVILDLSSAGNYTYSITRQ